MKIKVVSDLHLEFDTIEIKNNGADVLILSGDICLAADFGQGHFNELNNRAKRYVKFFEQVCGEFKNVIYISGNHEHYHGDFAQTIQILRNNLTHPNLHILDCGMVDLDGVLFVGGTLWTDFNKSNPVAMFDAQRMMNDYRTVCNGENHSFLPSDTVMYHEHMIDLIDKVHNDEHRKIVVCGHHAPSFSSISGRYVGHQLNDAYASNLERFIEDHPKVKLWTHGHIHTSSDYMIAGTRVVCNPRGYADYEENPTFDPELIIEI